jgi:hypothetical protein
MLFIDQIKEKAKSQDVKWRGHATQRLIQRNIKRKDVLHAILNSQLIEEYPHDYPFPSCLLLGFDTIDNPLHIVCAVDKESLWIITVYKPDNSRWENNFKTRKR